MCVRDERRERRKRGGRRGCIGEGERGGNKESQDVTLIFTPMHTPSPHTHTHISPTGLCLPQQFHVLVCTPLEVQETTS